MPDTATPSLPGLTATGEAGELIRKIQSLRDSLTEATMRLEDVWQEHFVDVNGEPVGLPAAAEVLAMTAMLRYEAEGVVESAAKLHGVAVQVFYVESERYGR